MRTASWVIAIAAVVAGGGCGEDDELPPLTDATSLRCPEPGALPFRLGPAGFANDVNVAIADGRTRRKGEAADILGNPGGPYASTYLDAGEPVEAGGALRGKAARSAENNGLFSTPLPGERISIWTYAAGAWTSLGAATTDDDGAYTIELAARAQDQAPSYAMLEADGSCAEHYDYLLPRGAPVVVTDIDGTLTASDAELFEETADPSYVQRTKGAAVALTNAWRDKGYTVVYLTARPHVFRTETRRWLRDLGFAPGPVITANESAPAAAYKAGWLARITTDLGWSIAAVYGNADTDIAAYATAGIPKPRTFIIGPLAGSDDTTPIPDDDYTDHIRTFVTTL